MGKRSEERGVGFDQDAIPRRDADGLAELIGGIERDDPREREREAERQAGLGFLRRAAEAVDDAADGRRVRLGEDAEQVRESVAAMDHER